MPGTLTNVVKGYMLGQADARLSQRQNESTADYRDRLQELLDRFEQGDALIDHAKKRTAKGNDLTLVSNAEHEKHVQDEFLGADPSAAFFPNMPGNSEGEIVRGGYIRAIELALGSDPKKPAKPIVSYWIINGRKDTDTDAFEIFVAESEHEVHVLMMTPKPTHVSTPPEDLNRIIDEQIFVVSSTQRIKEIESAFPEGYQPNRIPLTGAMGVECLQVVGY